MMIKFILNYMMNTQTQILNPSYSLRQSTLSMGRPQAQANLYATSQVNLFAGNPQQQYFVTSTRPSQQVNASFQAQALSASQLNTYTNQNAIPYSVYLSQNKQVTYKEKKQSESRITYHPYVRTYIDYEERVVLVPVERVKINYYEKIYETQYVPQAIEEIVTETVPMEKDVLKVQYIPVQQKIVHFPKEEKKAGSAGQIQRKIIYYDANGQQVTKSRHQAVLKSNFTNFVTTSQQNFIPHVQVQQTVARPLHVTFNTSKKEVSQTQIIKPQNESEIYHEEPQIILNQNQQQNTKQLGESHVKQVFKSTINA